MAQAARDENRVTTLIGVSSVDLVTPARVAVDPTTGHLLLDIYDTSKATAKTLQTVTGSVNNGTSNTVIAAVTGKRIKVIAYSLVTASTSAVTVTFKSDTAGTALWTVPLQAITGTNFGANLSIEAPSFLFATEAGKLLDLTISAAQTVTYSITYFSDDAV
jgi:hypothetical protein